MKKNTNSYQFFTLILGMFLLFGCTNHSFEKIEKIDEKPEIEPDYTEVTIPYNIAPLNFKILNVGGSYEVLVNTASESKSIKIKSQDGIIQFSEKTWKKIISNNRGEKIEIQVFSISPDKKTKKAYLPFFITVANDSIDTYLAYRLIHPGYYSWSTIKIMQRSLESFQEKSLVENQVIDKNCVNCHSFNQNNPNEFLIHIRGSKGGTYFADGENITRTNLKTENMPGGATYPSWHPGGRYVAFSSNQVRQNFYAHAEKSIEVYDLVSSLILYDRKTNEIITVTEEDSSNPMQTFPSWSPDGKYLYFCQATQDSTNAGRDLNDIKNIHYNIVKKSFDPSNRTFGEPELIFDASEMNKSVSFPRISPDGRYLIFTLQDYGTFPIWHEEADLHILDLQNGETKKLSINSDKTESYHTWSSNSKWLVFSSKRLDGRSARPFFAHIGSYDQIGKPFVLPQKDPTYYNRMLESFNIPEFVSGKIQFAPRDFAAAVNQEPISAVSGDPYKLDWNITNTQTRINGSDRGIHE